MLCLFIHYRFHCLQRGCRNKLSGKVRTQNLQAGIEEVVGPHILRVPLPNHCYSVSSTSENVALHANQSFEIPAINEKINTQLRI